jgi:2-amino-4-hydroxy-6-hydroxymethyldihydropteridine diphosphokinase
MNVAYLLIGGNLGDRLGYLKEAIKKISSQCGVIKQTSAIYESEAWGYLNQPNYLNQAIELQTEFDPHDLLNRILLIEDSMGRTREQIYGPRTIDIDILYFNDTVIKDSVLTIPHPRIAERQFVLIPMNEIASMHYDPDIKMTINEILSICKDNLNVTLHK